MLFGCYRRGDANDPDGYVAAISAVLSRYDVDLIREVTDPNTGIQTTEKFETFLPNSGELKRYCEAEDARMRRLHELGKLGKPDLNRPRLPPPPPAQGDQATIFVPASNARYAALLEWSKGADSRKFKFDTRPGIWVSWDTWDQRQVVARRQPDQEPSRFVLSEAAKRTMAEIDAQRTGNLPVDQQREGVE